MAKILKLIGIVVGTLILLAVIAAICLILFVDPNRFKPTIEKQFQAATGRQINISGDLSWKIFPTLGVKVGHVSINNPTGFNEPLFAEINEAIVSVKVLPLLHGQIQSNGILLDGLTLNLLKNKQGKVNWNFKPSTSVPVPNSEVPTTASSSAPVNAFGAGLMVSNVSVTNSNVFWQDEQKNQTYRITHFEFKAKNINLDKPFSIASAFDFAADKLASGHLSFQSDVAVDAVKKLVSLNNMDFAANIQKDKQHYDIGLTGNMDADMQNQQVTSRNVTGHVANMKFDSQLNVTHLSSTPNVKGNLKIKPFDLKQWLDETGQPVEALQEAKNVEGNVDFSAEGKNANAKGDVTIEEMQAAKLKISKVNSQFHFQNQVAYLDSLTGDLYQGTLKSQGKADLTGATPKMALQAILANVQAEPLFQDLQGPDQKLKLKGTGNLELNITTAGTEVNVIKQNLNGTTKFNFANGALVGVDLGYLVDNAYSLLKKREMSTENSNQTTFGNLTGTAVIQQGVINNNDLLIDSPRFTGKGKGTINLVAEKIDFVIQATVKKLSADQETGARDLYGMSIPIIISGNLNSPSVKIDTSAIAQQAAQQQIDKAKEKVQEKIQDKIKEKIPEASELLNKFLH